MSAEQYFGRYAEAETSALQHFPHRHYQQAVCIPVYDESPAFLQHITNAANHYSGKVLLILVINQPENCEFNENNEKLATLLKQLTPLWQADNLVLANYGVFDILWVNRFSPGLRIPTKQGVGLARKIAADIASWLVINGHITAKYFFCSDADVVFPDNYFSTILPEINSAGVLGFRHIDGDNPDINNATQLYEKSLYHYVNSLQKAGSAYAFHTIGSCLVLNTRFYLQARGFPVKPAGEDFYLLNKLQKLAPVIQLKQTVINIASRLSTRVPFGTGPAVEKLLLQKEAAIFYHPNCFIVLKAWLEYLNQMANNGEYSNPQHSDIDIQICLQELDTLFNTEVTLHKIFTNHKNPAARSKHLHEWFDGFKTLKAIHYLRDTHFPSITYNAFITYKPDAINVHLQQMTRQ